MTSRTRAFVLAVSIPVIAFVVIGGYLGQALAKDDTYQHLRVFEDVVSLVLNNYVEEVDVTDAMKGAMKGLADGLDPESAYLTPELAKTVQSNDASDLADVGLALTRQYYLRIVAAKDGSPARARRTAQRRLHSSHRQPSDARHVGIRGRAAAARGARLEGVAARHPRQRGRPARRRPRARTSRTVRT